MSILSTVGAFGSASSWAIAGLTKNKPQRHRDTENGKRESFKDSRRKRARLKRRVFLFTGTPSNESLGSSLLSLSVLCVSVSLWLFFRGLGRQCAAAAVLPVPQRPLRDADLDRDLGPDLPADERLRQRVL